MRIDKVIKKDERNVTVYLDNDEKLYLSYEVFLKNGLRKNMEISEGHFSLLVKENQIYHIKQRAWRFLARRMHSMNEMRIKLKQKGYDHILIEDVLGELVQKGYLDDAKFAAMFAEENIKSKLWGFAKIKAELFKKELILKLLMMF